MKLRTIFCTLGLIGTFMAQASSYTEKLVERKENFYRYEYDYDAQGNQTLYGYYDILYGIGYHREERSYDEENRLSSLVVYESWEDGTWKFMSKETYEYGQQDQVLAATRNAYRWQNGEWVYLGVSEKTYDEEGKLVLEKSGSYQTLYTYDAEGRPLQEIGEEMRNGEFVPYSLKEWTYGENGVLMVTSYTYDADGSLSVVGWSRYVYNGSSNDYVCYKENARSSSKEKEVVVNDPSIRYSHYLHYYYDNYADNKPEEDRYYLVTGWDTQYDEQDRLIMKASYAVWSGSTKSNNKEEYQYDEQGNVVFTTYYTKSHENDEWEKYSARKMDNIYDDRGALLQSVTYWTGDFETWEDSYIDTYVYDTSVAAEQIAGCPSKYYKLLSFERAMDGKIYDSQYYTYAPMNGEDLNSVSAEHQEAPHYYDLMGRKHDAPTSGFSIEKQGNTVKKVLSR